MASVLVMGQLRRALLFQIGGLTLLAVTLFLLSRLCPLPELLATVQERVMSWGAWSAICYPLLYACCNVLLLPGGLLSVGGGFFFGLWWGFFIVLLGNLIGAAISFFISRWIGKRWLRKHILRNAAMEALEPAVEREGWKIILLSQLHPLFPTSLMNYLYGLTSIRFRACMLWIAIGQAPGLFLYTYLGTLGQLGLKLFRGKTHPRSVEYLIWGGGFLFTAIVLFLLGRVALRLLREAELRSSRNTGNVQVIRSLEAVNRL